MKVGHRRGVDDAQRHPSAGFDPDHLGVCEVRLLARQASYLTSFRSGAAVAPYWGMPVNTAIRGAPAGVIGMLPLFLKLSKICSGGVKLRSLSITTTSC